MAIKVLIIGVEYYDAPALEDLPCVHEDVRRLTVAFEGREGCRVLPGSGAHHRLEAEQLAQLVEDAALECVPADVLFVVYSGHGVGSGIRSYFVPSGARAKYLPEGCPGSYLPSLLEDGGTGLPARTVLFFDACRNDPGDRGGARSSANRAAVKAESTAIFLREVAKGVSISPPFAQVSASAPGGRAGASVDQSVSYFSAALADHLEAGDALSLTGLRDGITRRMAVLRKADGLQSLQRASLHGADLDSWSAEDLLAPQASVPIRVDSEPSADSVLHRAQRPTRARSPLRFLLAPGVTLFALSQGGGELAQWPALVLDYGWPLLLLLVVAGMAQWAFTYLIGRYTVFTGEGPLIGFLRMHRGAGLVVWGLFTFAFLWFSAYARISIAMLVQLGVEAGLVPKAQQAAWVDHAAALMIALVTVWFVVADLQQSRRKGVVRGARFAAFAAILSVVGVVVLASMFGGSLELRLTAAAPVPFDRWWLVAQACVLIGLGGFWNFLYASWVQQARWGLNVNVERRPKALTVSSRNALNTVHREAATAAVRFDSLLGTGANVVMALVICCIVLSGQVDSGSLQSGGSTLGTISQHASRLGPTSSAVFLVVAAAFLVDTFYVTLASVTWMHAEVLRFLLPERWIDNKYVQFATLRAFAAGALAMLSIVIIKTGVSEARALSVSQAVMVLAMATMPTALFVLNYRFLPAADGPLNPRYALHRGVIAFVCAGYVVLGVVYVGSRIAA